MSTMRAGTFGNITLTVDNGMLEVRDVLRLTGSQVIPVANIAIVRKHFGKVTVHASDGSRIVIPAWNAGAVVTFIRKHRAA